MAISLIGIPSRITLFVCGMFTLALSRVYFAVQGLDPASHGSWSLFSVAFIVVGAVAVVIALLPGSWVERAFKTRPGQRSLVPIKVFRAFAIASYLLNVGLSLAPHGWPRSPQLVFAVCPACALTITVDPLLVTVLLVLAPLSAAVYGSLGAILGYLSVVSRNRG